MAGEYLSILSDERERIVVRSLVLAAGTRLKNNDVESSCKLSNGAHGTDDRVRRSGGNAGLTPGAFETRPTLGKEEQNTVGHVQLVVSVPLLARDECPARNRCPARFAFTGSDRVISKTINPPLDRSCLILFSQPSTVYSLPRLFNLHYKENHWG